MVKESNRMNISSTLADLNVLAIAGVGTLAEARVLLCAAKIGEGATLKQITTETKIPYTSVSRILWSLSQAGFLKYKPSAQDRRRKFLVVNAKRLNCLAPK